MFENGNDLVQYLLSAMSYLPAGYVFLAIYSHIAPSDFTKSFQDSFLRTIVVGFFLDFCYSNFIITKFKFMNNQVYFIFFAVICAYILAQLLSSRLFKGLMGLLRINRHNERNIWCSISDKQYPVWVTVYFRENNVCYQGEVVSFEDSSTTPQIVLARYKKYLIVNGRIDSENLLSDFSNDYQSRVLLNTEIADSIELFYHPKSKVVSKMMKALGMKKQSEEKEKKEEQDTNKESLESV